MSIPLDGNICLHFVLHFADQLRALIATEACDFSPGRWMDWLWHPHMHGDEVPATPCYGLMAPRSPEEYRQETWWYYAQSGPWVFRGDLWFRSVDHDFRDRCEQVPGTVPIYFFMTGE